MTFEHKIVVGLDDVRAVTFECCQCQARLTVSPDKLQVPRRCQQCDAPWIIGTPMHVGSSTSSYVNFANAIGEIREQLSKGAPFKLLLEFDAPIPR
jgi:hypothetical protein